MKPTNSLILSTLVLLLTACQPQSSPSAPLPTLEPAPTSTATSAPIVTELASLPTETVTVVPPLPGVPTDLFGLVSSQDVQAGFVLEPVVAQIFEGELQRFIVSGEIKEFRVERVGVYPKGDGTLYAEVFYAVKAGDFFWPEDGGALGEDGWVTGKCSRFDFVITPKEYQLKNKRLCS